jgi:hypothetical protein
MQSELKKQEEIEPLLIRLENAQIRKGTKNVHERAQKTFIRWI